MILLRQYAGAAEAASMGPRWRGGVYRLLEHKKDRRAVLAFCVDWDSEQTAREFLGLYRKVLEGKWKKPDVRAASEDEIRGVGDDGRFVVRRAGTAVSSVEGLRPEEERALER